MIDPVPSSRSRYQKYRAATKNRKSDEISEQERQKIRAMGSPRTGRRHRTFWQLLVRFNDLLAGFRQTLGLALTGLGISTLLGLLPIYGTKLIFDNVLLGKPVQLPAWIALPHSPRALLATVCIGMVVIAVISMLVGTASRWQATRISKRVQVATRKRAFEQAIRLPLHRVYDLKSGGVASILREDAGGVGDLVFSLVYNPSHAVVQLLGSLAILAFIDWRMLLGASLLLPVVWFTHRTWIARIRPLWRDARMTRQKIDAHTTESFGGMRVVRSFSRQRSEANRFTTDNHFMARQELLGWWMSRGIDAAWAVIIPLASALLLWYGGNRVLDDMRRLQDGSITQSQALTPGDLVMFLGYLTALLGPIAVLAGTATQLQGNLAGLDRILDLLEEPREFSSHPGKTIVDKRHVDGRITLNNVCFSYTRQRLQSAESRALSPGASLIDQDADHPATPPLAGNESAHGFVLENINLDVQAGQTIALVGPSGAGKTTLCNLIARFFDPTAGSVALDGLDLREIRIDSYRRLLGIVEQDTFLFDGSIAQNIAYGNRSVNINEVITAARQANAHEFITQLENGYDTVIGERGVKLSGGQRQRLTIARAILADPKILILDEATSNLDTESERLIQHSLASLMNNRTSFIIAHRLSTIRNADRIIVIDQGRIIEQGTHDELMKQAGHYQQMVFLQTADQGVSTTDRDDPQPHRWASS